MKCNQCNMLQVSNGGVSLPTHEIGCLNANRIWNEEEQEWQDRQALTVEDDDEDWMEDVEDEWGDEDDDDFDDEDEDEDDDL